MSKFRKILAGGLVTLAMAGCQVNHPSRWGRNEGVYSNGKGNPEALLGFAVTGAGVQNNNPGVAAVGRGMLDYGIAKEGRSNVNQEVNINTQEVPVRESYSQGGIVLANIADVNGDGKWDKEKESADWNNPTRFFNDSYMLIMARGNVYGGKNVRVLIKDLSGNIIGEGENVFVPNSDSSQEVVGNLVMRKIVDGYAQIGKPLSSEGTSFRIELYESDRGGLIGSRNFSLLNQRNPRKVSVNLN